MCLHFVRIGKKTAEGNSKTTLSGVGRQERNRHVFMLTLNAKVRPHTCGRWEMTYTIIKPKHERYERKRNY